MKRVVSRLEWRPSRWQMNSWSDWAIPSFFVAPAAMSFIAAFRDGGWFAVGWGAIGVAWLWVAVDGFCRVYYVEGHADAPEVDADRGGQGE